MKKVALIGYSGHAYVVADILLKMGYAIIGYFEKSRSLDNPYNLDYLGNEEDCDLREFTDICFFSAIGNNSIRKNINTYLRNSKLQIATAVSCSAYVSETAKVAPGCMIGANACLNAMSVIEMGVIVNTGAIIEHENLIRNHVHIGPGAVLTGNVKVGENSFIGSNAVVKQGVEIGSNTIIGAGSVVLCDIPEKQIWAGNPAKYLKSNE